MESDRDNLHTDTHLSRDFNKVLQGLMMQCNNSAFYVMSSPHYDYLQAYYAAVNDFFMNTFFLFGNVQYENANLTLALMDKMKQVKDKIYSMKYYPQTRTREYFDSVVEICNLIHMMIMYGLHRRNMLVRMSENEPKGAQAIEYWDKKTAFKKGDLKIETVTLNNKRFRVI